MEPKHQIVTPRRLALLAFSCAVAGGAVTVAAVSIAEKSPHLSATVIDALIWLLVAGADLADLVWIAKASTPAPRLTVAASDLKPPGCL